MSDNIPFEIQMEIIKKVSDVKSLIRFRSVSKPWKSFIDSSDFINGYGARITQPHSFMLTGKVHFRVDVVKYIRLVEDDNNETFKVQRQEFAPSVVSPLIKQLHVCNFVGACHGLLCLFCYSNVYYKNMVVIWNPCIRKSFGIVVPRYDPQLVFGFAVCPINRDPTVVKIKHEGFGMPWHVEVFTLSSGVWNVIPTGNLPRQTIRLANSDNSTHVVIDRFIYWGAYEETFTDGESTTNHMVVSFGLITKEFKVVYLPDSLTKELRSHVSVSKLRESLVVSGHVKVEGAICCGVWVMEHDSSFRKLFTIGTPLCKILGFRKNGEPVFERKETNGQSTRRLSLNVYDPCLQQIKYLGISRLAGSFFMGSYKESLLLLDHSDLHIYSDVN